VTRLIDLIAVLIVALVVLLPQPGVVVQPALLGDKADLDRLAVLEDAVFRAPDDVDSAVELGRAYLRAEQPAWAVAALRPHLTKSDYRVHQVMASAYATLLKPDLALKEAEAGIKACEAAGPRCPEPASIRLAYIANLVRDLAQLGIDPAREPLKAKQRVQAELRATKARPPSLFPMKPAPTPTPPSDAKAPGPTPTLTPTPTPTPASGSPSPPASGGPAPGSHAP
jgi:hypothetical protein